MIYVIGSSNTDMVVKSARLPDKGETVIGGDFFMNPGGKGANQAVAAARLGVQVSFVCKVGNDVFGQQALAQFQREHIQTDFVSIDKDLSSGVALINVDANGENSITVATGANGALSRADVLPALEEITRGDILLIQLEIPIETVLFSVQKAFEKGARVILNPAPAHQFPDDIYPYIFAISPNETEAELLTGIKVTDEQSAVRAADKLLAKGCHQVIMTLGSKGALVKNNNETIFVSPPKVKALDSTAAGDCFNGAFAVAIARGKSAHEAAHFACHAAAISVTRMGAQASMPNAEQVEQFIAEQG